jgi:hypothetical protein
MFATQLGEGQGMRVERRRGFGRQLMVNSNNNETLASKIASVPESRL